MMERHEMWTTMTATGTYNRKDAYEYASGFSASHLLSIKENIMPNHKSIILNKGQQAAVDAIVNGHNVFVTGAGGCGKSIVIGRAVEALRNFGKEVLVCAPTGIAAQQIHGSTIHSAFKFSYAPKVADELDQCRPSKAVRAADVIVIDEVGMVRRDQMDAIAHVIETERHRRNYNDRRPLQLVCVGDFLQLPPVVTDKERLILFSQYKLQANPLCMYAFASEGWLKMRLETHVLDKIMRQSNPLFIRMLNLARIGDLSCIGYFDRLVNNVVPDDAVYIVARNKEAEAINSKRLEQLEGPEVSYCGVAEGDFNLADMASPLYLILRRGARVILTANKAGVYVNGSTGTVVDYSDDSVTIRLDDSNIVEIEPYRWENCTYEVEEAPDGKKHLVRHVVGSYTQYPIKLAWAITYHRSQGKTLSNVVINPDTFGAGMLYVGLSRATSASGIRLTSKIDPICIKADPAVVSYYELLYASMTLRSA